MPFSMAVVDKLENNGVGVFGENLFVGTRPQNPVDCLTVYDTGGMPPRKDETKDLTFQIISRAEKYTVAENQAQQAHLLFEEQYYNVMGEFLVLLMEAQGEPAHIGRDENDNHLFSTNYHVWIRKYNF